MAWNWWTLNIKTVTIEFTSPRSDELISNHWIRLSFDMKNYADRGNTLWDLHNFSHHATSESSNFFSYILCTYWLNRRVERENIWLEVRACGPRAAVRTHGHHFLQPRSGVFYLFFLEARGRTLGTRFALVKQLSHAFCPFSIIDVDWYWYRRILSKFRNSWLWRICQRI